MKKVLIAALVLVVGASLSFAHVGLYWNNGGGYIVAHDESIDDGDGIANATDVLWQLIFAGNAIDDPDLTAEHFVGGDDVFLADRVIPATGGAAADGTKWRPDLTQLNPTEVTPFFTISNEEGAAAYIGKYVYQRIWEGLPSAAGDIYYYDSEMFLLEDWAGAPNLPKTFGYATDGVKPDKYIPGSGEVPEPATMSLLGLGALAMVLRRKLRK